MLLGGRVYVSKGQFNGSWHWLSTVCLWHRGPFVLRLNQRMSENCLSTRQQTFPPRSCWSLWQKAYIHSIPQNALNWVLSLLQRHSAWKLTALAVQNPSSNEILLLLFLSFPLVPLFLQICFAITDWSLQTACTTCHERYFSRAARKKYLWVCWFWLG